MTTTTPTTLKAEQERVLRQMAGVLRLLLSDDEAMVRAVHVDIRRIYTDMAPAHAALLAAHAEALELLQDCDAELDDLMRRVRRLAQDAPDDDTTDADELRRRIATLTAQAPAGGEG